MQESPKQLTITCEIVKPGKDVILSAVALEFLKALISPDESRSISIRFPDGEKSIAAKISGDKKQEYRTMVFLSSDNFGPQQFKVFITPSDQAEIDNSRFKINMSEKDTAESVAAIFAKKQIEAKEEQVALLEVGSLKYTVDNLKEEQIAEVIDELANEVKDDNQLLITNTVEKESIPIFSVEKGDQKSLPKEIVENTEKDVFTPLYQKLEQYINAAKNLLGEDHTNNDLQLLIAIKDELAKFNADFASSNWSDQFIMYNTVAMWTYIDAIDPNKYEYVHVTPNIIELQGRIFNTILEQQDALQAAAKEELTSNENSSSVEQESVTDKQQLNPEAEVPVPVSIPAQPQVVDKNQPKIENTKQPTVESTKQAIAKKAEPPKVETTAKPVASNVNKENIAQPRKNTELDQKQKEEQAKDKNQKKTVNQPLQQKQPDPKPPVSADEEEQKLKSTAQQKIDSKKDQVQKPADQIKVDANNKPLSDPKKVQGKKTEGKKIEVPAVKTHQPYETLMLLLLKKDSLKNLHWGDDRLNKAFNTLRKVKSIDISQLPTLKKLIANIEQLQPLDHQDLHSFYSNTINDEAAPKRVSEVEELLKVVSATIAQHQKSFERLSTDKSTSTTDKKAFTQLHDDVTKILAKSSLANLEKELSKDIRTDDDLFKMLNDLPTTLKDIQTKVSAVNPDPKNHKALTVLKNVLFWFAMALTGVGLFAYGAYQVHHRVTKKQWHFFPAPTKTARAHEKALQDLKSWTEPKQDAPKVSG